MPVTKWTYLVACWAIAGFPWASGFYSKDEILWKAFTQEGMAFPFLGFTPHLGQLIYLMGIIAATGTSFYMFRSYYMTFTGEYRGQAHGHATTTATATASLPKESPLSITLVLVTLAAGAVLAAVIGIPYRLDRARAPSSSTGSRPRCPRWCTSPRSPHAMEYLFQAIGVSAGAGRLGLRARSLYKDGKSQVPARLLERWQGAWTVVYNKYYVDELYQATVIRGSVAFGAAAARGSTSTSSTGW